MLRLQRHSWIHKLFTPRPATVRKSARHRARLSVETFEDRTVPSLTSVFEIDGNATTAVGDTGLHDWDQVFSKTIYGNPGTGAVQFTDDGVNAASDTTFSNSPKDTQDITSWKWGQKAVSAPKTDLEHGFAAAYQDSGYTTNGGTHTLLYVGTDRFASGSNSAISIWFLQHPIDLGANGTFKVKGTTGTPETHANGDLLIQASLGSTATVTAYQWDNGTLKPFPLDATKVVYAINTSPLTSPFPWTFSDSSGASAPLAQEFFEVGLDLNEIFGVTDAPDYSSFIITSRTSTSQTATLNDFILGRVSSGADITVTNTPVATPVTAGGPVGFDVTVSNIGVGAVTNVTLDDKLPLSVNWSITGPNPAGFLLSDYDGVNPQVLSLPAGTSVAFNSSLSVRVTGTSTGANRPSISSTATVTGGNEGADFTFNNTATATITVNNRNPIAVNDTYSTPFNTTLTILTTDGVLVHNTDDYDADGDSLTVTGHTNPGHGTLSIANDGSFTYTPNTGFTGPTDSFQYTISDGHGGTATATVTITIGVNAPPAAKADAADATEAGGVSNGTPGVNPTGNVLTNDTDPDPSTTLAVAAGDTGTRTGSYGTLVLNSDGSYTYTVDNSNAAVEALRTSGDTLTDVFAYHAFDGLANSTSTANLTVTIHGANDAPAAKADAADATEAGGVNNSTPGVNPTGNVLTNDTDVDSGDTKTVTTTGTTAGNYGSLVLNADGSFTYTVDNDNADVQALNAGGTLIETFSYTMRDTAGLTTAAELKITIRGANDAPVAVDDSATTAEDTAKSFTQADLKGNDTDVDNSNAQLSVTAVSNPTNGTVVLNGDGTVTFTPAANFNGTAGFDYTLSDGGLTDTGHVTIDVTPVNDKPTADPKWVTTSEDTPKTITLSGSDVESVNLTFVILSGPAHGTLSIITNVTGVAGSPNTDTATVVYTPDANYNGPDSFTYKVTDTGDGAAAARDSDQATVTITVTPVNDPPVAADDAYSTDEDTDLIVDAPGVLANDSDLDGDPLTADLVTGPSHGTLDLNDDGSFTYTPADGYNGPDSFTYTISDGHGGTDTATVSITVTSVNDAPVAADDNYETAEDTPLIIPAPGVLGNDSDLDGDTLSAVQVSDPAHGTVTLNADGSFTYTPDSDYNGPDSFTYKANDGTADSNTVTVTITVTPVNDGPTDITIDPVVTNENTVFVLGGSFTDADGGEHTVTIDWDRDGSPDETIHLDAGVTEFSASHIYVDDNPTGTASDKYLPMITVTDSSDASASIEADVTVYNVAPELKMSAGTITLSVDDGFLRPVSFSDLGIDDTWTAEIDYGDGSDGTTLYFNPEDGKAFTLMHIYDTSGIYWVTVTVTDDDGGVATKTFKVIVNAE